MIMCYFEFNILCLLLDGGHFANKASRILFLKAYCGHEIKV